MGKKIRVEICGGIASGRTTLASYLNTLGFCVLKEHFEVHPFLKKFYENVKLFSFETELVFALQHYHDIKIASTHYKKIVCDNSLILDLAFADVTLKKNESKVFENLQHEIVSQIGMPNLVIYLKASPEFLLKRMVERGREMEIGIELSYLKELTYAIEKRIQNMKDVKILTLEPEKYDIVYNETDRKRILKKIEDSLSN